MTPVKRNAKRVRASAAAEAHAQSSQPETFHALLTRIKVYAVETSATIFFVAFVFLCADSRAAEPVPVTTYMFEPFPASRIWTYSPVLVQFPSRVIRFLPIDQYNIYCNNY